MVVCLCGPCPRSMWCHRRPRDQTPGPSLFANRSIGQIRQGRPPFARLPLAVAELELPTAPARAGIVPAHLPAFPLLSRSLDGWRRWPRQGLHAPLSVADPIAHAKGQVRIEADAFHLGKVGRLGVQVGGQAKVELGAIGRHGRVPAWRHRGPIMDPQWPYCQTAVTRIPPHFLP